jgi:hypothetical protein
MRAAWNVLAEDKAQGVPCAGRSIVCARLRDALLERE